MEKSAIWMAIFMGLYGPLFTGAFITIHRSKNQNFFVPRQEVFLNYTDSSQNHLGYTTSNSFNISHKSQEEFPFSMKKLSSNFEFYAK